MKRLEDLTFEKLEQMKEEGMTEKEISEYFGITVPTFRAVKAGMLHARSIVQTKNIRRMLERGMSQKEIAECLGISESASRALKTDNMVE